MAIVSASSVLGRALVRGTGASLASTLALMALGKRETGSAYAGLNAVSHWAWGDADARRNGFSVKHTVVGALTQQAASVFWALLFEPLFASRRRRPTVARLATEAAAMSAIACAVDYTITPKRLTPGYELRLGKPSMAGVYVAFAAGLALASLAIAPRAR
jgi:hypothetical protein